MSAANTKNCTHFKVRNLSRSLSRIYDAELAKAGLKTTQYSLLGLVHRRGPVSAGELARGLGIDASTLTRNLQPLLATGWLSQEPGADARCRRIAITAAGRDKLGLAHRHWRCAQQQIDARLGAERVQTLHALLDDCLGRLQADAEIAA